VYFVNETIKNLKDVDRREQPWAVMQNPVGEAITFPVQHKYQIVAGIM
jgi:hypothetical protein